VLKEIRLKATDLVAGSTCLRSEALGTTTCETEVLMALSWSSKHSVEAKKATMSRELRIPTNLCCLVSLVSIMLT